MEPNYNLESSPDTSHSLARFKAKTKETRSGSREEYRHSPSTNDASSPGNEGRRSNDIADPQGIRQWRCRCSWFQGQGQCYSNASSDSPACSHGCKGLAGRGMDHLHIVPSDMCTIGYLILRRLNL